MSSLSLDEAIEHLEGAVSRNTAEIANLHAKLRELRTLIVVMAGEWNDARTPHGERHAFVRCIDSSAPVALHAAFAEVCRLLGVEPPAL